MGTDDSNYNNKRGIANISRNLLASTVPPMRSTTATKFFLITALLTSLIYVLADRLPSSRRDVSSRLLHPPAPRLFSENLSAPHSVKKDVETEKTEEVVEVSEKHRAWVERNIEKMCNHTVVGWGEKTVMHDILTYLSMLNKPITYLDVGANVGITSLPAFHCFKQQHRVIAIEPVKVNFEKLMSAKAGMSVRPVPESQFLGANIGFSDETKTTTMWIPGRRGDNAALAEKASTIVFKGGLRKEEVQVYRGDEFLKMHNAEPKLIKIDVQGSEIRVLRGMEKFLKSHNDLLVMAEHDQRLISNSGFEIFDVYDFMKKLGFMIYFRPEVGLKDDMFYVESQEVERDLLPKLRGDLVFWKSGST